MPAVISPSSTSQTPTKDIWEDDDDGWQEMEVVRHEGPINGMDEEDRKKYKYVAPQQRGEGAGNATGVFDDIDYRGQEWRTKLDQDENDYTRLRVEEEDESDQVHLRTRYLFDEDKAMTPLSQMQATKNLLTEAQRIAYVGLCALTGREMAISLTKVKSKELNDSIKNLELWTLKIMGRLYYHMDLATAEQKMIQSLGEHGVTAMDLAPALMTTHTVANPEYDPVEAHRAQGQAKAQADEPPTYTAVPPSVSISEEVRIRDSTRLQTTTNILTPTESVQVPGVSTSLSITDKDITLDIRWTVLCDLFLLLIADSVYDARSRVLLENVATKLGLGWLDVARFEKRVTDALEIEEGAQKLESQEVLEGRMKAAKKKRYIMMGLATIGGGLVIGLSAGLLAPFIGAGLAGALSTIGVTGTGTFLAGAGGAAIITTGGVLTGSGIAVKGMARRTQQVRTFELLPLHNNKRVSCIITVPGFTNGLNDDVRLPFSVLDPVVGDVFSVRWEPEMMEEMGNALQILSTEVLSQVGQTVLQATFLSALMGAIQWPLLLTKLGYLIDNPWSNALDRAKAAGLVLADVLIQRTMGVRPITLIGFSLGARMIFYCLLELARQKAFGIVQDVFLLGATFSASRQTWLQARSVIAGRFVNCFARNDWVLGYLFRATIGGLGTVTGLRPVEHVPGLENVDVTDKIAGHNSYRTYMPLILDQLGFPVSADYFDEPEEIVMTTDREVIREGEDKKSGFSLFGRKETPSKVSRPPGVHSHPISRTESMSPSTATADDDLPPRTSNDAATSTDQKTNLPKYAGFDFQAIKEVIVEEDIDVEKIPLPHPGSSGPVVGPVTTLVLARPAQALERSESAPPLISTPPGPIGTPELPDTPTQPVAQLPHDATATIPSTFSRSLSLNDLHEDETAQASTSSPVSPTAPTPHPLRETVANPYRQTPAHSDTSVVSFGSAGGDIWVSGATPSTDTQLSFGRVDGTIFGGTSNPYGNYYSPTPYGLRNGSAIGGESNPFAAATTLTFGGADGSISNASEDHWKPKPITSEHKKYTPNPWDN